MKVVLLHNHYDKKKLEDVKNEVIKLGTPTIRVYSLGFDNLYQAIEGCHRLRACEQLGIEPNIEEIDENMMMIADLKTDWSNDDCRAIECGDTGNYTICF